MQSTCHSHSCPTEAGLQAMNIIISSGRELNCDCTTIQRTATLYTDIHRYGGHLPIHLAQFYTSTPPFKSTVDIVTSLRSMQLHTLLTCVFKQLTL